MNRTEKKCLFASVGFHLLLVVILLVGPAFLSSRNKYDDLPVIDFIPSKLIDGPFAGGGNPNARPPAPAPPTPAQPAAAQPPPPQPAPRPAPEQVKKLLPANDVKMVTRDGEIPDKKSTGKSTLNTKLVTRPRPTTGKTDSAAADADARARAEATRIAKEFGGAAGRLRNGLSSATVIDEPYGPGGGGETYAPYASLVKAIYEQAWVPPDDTASDDAVVKVTVTIASDGKVTNARVIGPSGDAKVDESVKRTLNRVQFIAPFPEGAKEKERTYTINFNLKAKRLLG